MLTLHFVLLVAALLCFVFAVLGFGNGRLVPLGLACWLLATTLVS